MVRTQIQLSERQAKVIRKIAVSQHLSMSEVIRRAVDIMIKSTKEIDPEERYKRAIQAVGKFRSGRRDISTKHDIYLTEAYNK